jgi:type VI protein secretion system component VasF
MTHDKDISPAEQCAERPLWRAMLDGEVIVTALLIFALAWQIHAMWVHHKTEKKIHQIEQCQ